MKKVSIYNVFDSVSENWLGNFFANSEGHAKSIFQQFLKKNDSIIPNDVKLFKVCDFDSPVLSEDKDIIVEVPYEE